jgi:hypothetical protein
LRTRLQFSSYAEPDSILIRHFYFKRDWKLRKHTAICCDFAIKNVETASHNSKEEDANNPSVSNYLLLVHFSLPIQVSSSISKRPWNE